MAVLKNPKYPLELEGDPEGRKEFVFFEGLSHREVSPTLESMDIEHGIGCGRQHDNGQARKPRGGPELTTDLVAIWFRHHDIEKDGDRLLPFC